MLDVPAVCEPSG